jgi:uncharacterized protein (TIGR03435 family)
MPYLLSRPSCKARSLNWLAAAFLLCCVTVPVDDPVRAFGSPQQDSPAAGRPTFEVVSIYPDHRNPSTFGLSWRKPDLYLAENYTLITTIELAYLPIRWATGGWGDARVVGAPNWVRKDRYDIRGKLAAEDVAIWQQNGPKKEQLLQDVLRAMLEDRCKIAVHRVMVDAPVFALVRSKPSARLKLASPDEDLPPGSLPLMEGGMIVPHVRGTTPFRITLPRISMAQFAALLSDGSTRPVIDKTGLAGVYDFSTSKLEPPEDSSQDVDPPVQWDLSEVGLKLVSTKAPLETIVIDHIERPSKN